MIHQLCERRLKAQTKTIAQVPGSASIPTPQFPTGPQRDCVEGVEVEHTSVGSDIAVSSAIRSLKRATIAKAEIPRIVTGTADRHEIRTGFRETHSANGIHQARDLLCGTGGKGICDLPRREDRKEPRVASNYGGWQPYSIFPRLAARSKRLATGVP